MDSGLDFVGTAGTFFRDVSGFADFRGFLLTGAFGGLALTDMAGFPGFSTLTFWGPCLVAVFAAGFAAGFAAVLAVGITAALDCVVCGFFGFLDLPGVALGMRPPDGGNFYEYLSATSQQKCASRLTAVKAQVAKIQSQKKKIEKQASREPEHAAACFFRQVVWANIWCAVLAGRWPSRV
ncbi:MAG: hypothetical protein Q8R06_03315 [Polaromonas sp.]|uniref:hypothetical protein n=1 Tax=Polaromonas sp. TaxID=1869339 RepID=UPI0027332C65|nr:hypothetical protein [Polaromonas sp.]MDP3796166.1 hypothetical protein [Polaromonas sp.]